MAKIPKFRVGVNIDALSAPSGHHTTSVIITGYSIDDAARRVVAALKLIDQANEETQDANPNRD